MEHGLLHATHSSSWWCSCGSALVLVEVEVLLLVLCPIKTWSWAKATLVVEEELVVPISGRKCTHRLGIHFIKHTAKRQLWVRPMSGSTLQAAWCARHAHWARLWYFPLAIRCLWITSTIWSLIPSCTSSMVGRSRVFCMYSSWTM